MRILEHIPEKIFPEYIFCLQKKNLSMIHWKVMQDGNDVIIYIFKSQYTSQPTMQLFAATVDGNQLNE